MYAREKIFPVSNHFDDSQHCPTSVPETALGTLPSSVDNFCIQNLASTIFKIFYIDACFYRVIYNTTHK